MRRPADYVYRMQSISSAAQELALTQGAVSKKILALEDYFGQALFERLASGLRRTSAADRLWTRLPQCLDELEEVMAEVKSHGSCSGVLNLAVCPTFATKWLVPRLPLLYQAHPDISLNLRVQLANVHAVARGKDAGIAYGQPGWPGGQAGHRAAAGAHCTTSPAEDAGTVPALSGRCQSFT